MSAITIGGELIHYEVLGRGRPVILLHGWVGSWRYWVPTMQNLQLKYRVYAIDLHGFGDTSKNDQKYHLSNQVQLLKDFMDAMAIPKAALIGHGLGAWVAIEFCRAHAEQIPRLMLITPPLFQTPGLDNRHRPGRPVALTSNSAAEPIDDRTIASSNSMRRQAMMELEILAKAKAAGDSSVGIPSALVRDDRAPSHNPLQDILANTPEALLQLCFKKSDPIFAKLEPDMPKIDRKAMRESAKEFDSGRLLDNLWLLPMPTVLLHGKEDALIKPPSDAVLDYISAEKDDTLVVRLLDGVKHFPMLEYERFNRLLNDFLELPDIKQLEIKERWKRRSR